MTRLLGLAPPLTLLLLLGPVAAGLVGTLGPALGYLPVLGGETLSTAPLEALMATPGLATMVALTLVASVGGGVLALLLVVAFAAAWHGTRPFRLMTRALSPLLAVPHAAAALGFAFLIAPSGLLARLFSPWATGWERPPDWLIVHDTQGLTLMAFLALKEMPFLFLMLLSALAQVDSQRTMAVARTLGYGQMSAWLKGVWPQVWPQLRLPFYAVLAYGASAVDVATLLGPTTPPPLAVQIVRWTYEPDLDYRFVAAAGSLLLLGIIVLILGTAWGVERLLAVPFHHWCQNGVRGARDGTWRLAGLGGAALVAAGILGGLVVLGVWSLARRWRFPDTLPAAWSLQAWERAAADLAVPVANTLVVGLTAVVVAVCLTVACLEYESLRRRPATRAMVLLYVPLLVPQVSFLFGLQVWMLWLGLAPDATAVAVAHLVYVLPYVFLSLADPWRRFDPRYATTAAGLGISPWRTLFAVKLPMLSRSVATATAVGFAVSVGQYLPTLLIGAGRVPTVATETVALATGGDRRLAAAAGLVQASLPALAFGLALVLPALWFRQRRGMKVS
ncbi:MAG: ABC transporter permease [Candidatus Competibacterales bacterium]